MNIANKISVFRLFFTVLFVITAYFDLRITAYTIGFIAGLSDILDGYIARKYNMETDLGKLIDPIADKILLFAAMLVFSNQNLINIIVVFIIISREFSVTALRAFLTSKQVKIIAADAGGKIKTIVQFTFLAVVGFFWVLHLENQTNIKNILDYASYLVAFITLYTGITYFLRYKKYYL